MPISMASNYSEQTEGALLCINKTTDWAIDVITTINHKKNICLLDYGAADGGTAVKFWGKIIGSIFSKNQEAEITLIGNDLPSNNNSELLNNLNFQLENFPTIKTLLSGRSFYEQIVPNCSVTFGFSATAMHWLSRPVHGLVNHTHPQRCENMNLFEKFKFQALTDWEEILYQRSKELASEGYLLTANLSRDKDGKYLGNNGGKTLNVHEEIHSIWKSFYEDSFMPLFEGGPWVLASRSIQQESIEGAILNKQIFSFSELKSLDSN